VADAETSQAATALAKPGQKKAARGKRRLIIHAGVHRTGTTAVQHAFSRNRPLLNAYGLAYPRDVADPPADVPDRRAFNHANLVWALNGKRLPLDRVSGWLKRATADGSRTVLLSSEDFSRITDLYFLDRLQEEFEIEIVFYLRRQDDWVNSWYSQVIKDSPNKALNATTPTQFLEFLGNFHWLNYFDLLERWGARVGRDNVKARVFGKGQIDDSVSDLFKYSCGKEPPPEIHAEASMGRQNESLTAMQVDLLRKLGANRFPERVRKEILAAAREVGGEGTKNHYPRAIRRMILDRYRYQNEKVAEVYLGQKGARLFLDEEFPEEAYGDGPEQLDERALLLFFEKFIETRPPGGAPT